MLLYEDRMNLIENEDGSIQIPRTPLDFDLLDTNPVKRFVYHVLGYAYLFNLSESRTTKDFLVYEKGERVT